jgi:hypothetical protein
VPAPEPEQASQVVLEEVAFQVGLVLLRNRMALPFRKSALEPSEAVEAFAAPGEASSPEPALQEEPA